MSDSTTTEHPISVSDLSKVLGEHAPARQMTAIKTSDCLKSERFQITGFVVTDSSGGIGIIDKSAVRWLTAQEMWWLMHESAQIGNTLDADSYNAGQLAIRDQMLTMLWAEYEDRKAQWGSDYLWSKHEDADAIEKVKAFIERTKKP